MQRERWLWCGTISGAIKQHTFLIASASNKSLPISRTKKPKNGVAIRVGRPSTNPLRLHHDELRVVILALPLHPRLSAGFFCPQEAPLWTSEHVRRCVPP